MTDARPLSDVVAGVIDDDPTVEIEPVPRRESVPQKRGSQRQIRKGARPKVHALRELKRAVNEHRGALARSGVPDDERPKTRGDCAGGQRPCPWVGCRHHLYLDVNPSTGAIRIVFPDLEPWDMVETCALDVAERGGATLDVVGQLANITRERARQIEFRGLAMMRESRELSSDDLHDDD